MLCLCLLFISSVLSQDLKLFDDNILHDIEWKTASDPNEDALKGEVITVKTSYLEEFKCHLPSLEESKSTLKEQHNVSSPVDLLAPLFKQGTCSIRLETYWTYELCHGRYIRQFHEEREGKKIKIQEYTLGVWNKSSPNIDLEQIKHASKIAGNAIQTKRIDNLDMPYYEVTMGNGTQCDLNDQRRNTSVLYVCYPHGKHEIYSLKEVSTCQYEAIVLTPELCAHPLYKPKTSSHHKITCQAQDPVTTSKPYNLLKMIHETKQMKRNTEDGETSIRFEFFLPSEANKPRVEDSKFHLKDVLDGTDCLQGGTGYWRFEYCHGKNVTQYHETKISEVKDEILLGVFNRDAHLEWMSKHPEKRPKKVGNAIQVSHFYSNGDVCEENKPRQTEVKLKCRVDTSSPDKVSLYLLEPNHCEYILGVETSSLCDLLETADKVTGLFEVDQTVTTKSYNL